MNFADQMNNAISCLLDHGHTQAAHWMLDKLLAEHPKVAFWHYQKALLGHESGNRDGVLNHFEQAAGLEPENPDYQKALGDFYHVIGNDASAALDRYLKVIELRPGDTQTLMIMAHLFVVQREFDKACEYYEKVIQLDPSEKEAIVLLDRIKKQSGTQQQPVFRQPAQHQAAHQQTNLAPDDLWQTAREQIQAGNTTAAIETCNRLLSKTPERPAVHNDLAILYFETGDKDNCLKHYQTAVQLEPDNLVFLKNLADFYCIEKAELKKAMELYVQVLTISPADTESMLAIGHICMALGHETDARFFLNRVVEIDMTNLQARQLLEQLDEKSLSEHHVSLTGQELYERALSKSENGDSEAAMNFLRQLITQDPNHALAYNDLGVICYDRGDKASAQTYYEQAVRLSPDNITFLKNLADFYLMELQKTEDAMKLYVKVLKSNPKDVDCLLATGSICLNLKNFDEARYFYQLALEIEPWNNDARHALEGLENSATIVEKENKRQANAK
ncbi:MAG: tetratricopeptide repeat protein [Desulfobacteraceae bacterium]|nr:tetratricopeptide repeat protein [Desulfobacteraceae bacterium]